MIGIKVKNSSWEKALQISLKQRAEICQEGKKYQIILTDLSLKEISKENYPKTHFIGLGITDYQFSLMPPFKITELESLIAQIVPNYENDFFIWDSAHRQLKNKKNRKKMFLTEKEADVIDFLCQCQNHLATKKELLENVWQYTIETETHTVESTINNLRRKIGSSADQLIIQDKKGYQLT